MITTKIVDAVAVQFLKPIFEDDFVEKGMKAWLTDVEWDLKTDCYKLYFDFTDFEAENLKYFKKSYYPNRVTQEKNLPEAKFYTALEAGQYEPKYSVYFSVPGDARNDELFEKEIQKYLRPVPPVTPLEDIAQTLWPSESQ
jgi:hypothetical protein